MVARPKIITKVLESIYPLHDDVVAPKFVERGYYEETLNAVGWNRALEIGCGTGRLLEVGRKYKKPMWGLDISLKFLKIAKERLREWPVDLVYGTATNLPFRDNSFDLAITFTMIHHLTDIEKMEMFKEIHRVSEWYAFGEVGRKVCWSAILLKIIGAKNLISKKILESAGFEVLQWKKLDGFCLIVGLARRLRGHEEKGKVGKAT